MLQHASDRPLVPATAQRLEGEVNEIRAIYDRLYPQHALTLVLLQGDDPIWGAPEVFEGPVSLGPQHVPGRFLGIVRRPGPRPDAAEVTVVLSVPRPPTEGEIRHAEAPWQPVRPLAPIFRMQPILYEDIRYRFEMRRKAKAPARHAHRPLPFGKGVAILSPDLPQPPADRPRPAILIGVHWLEVGGAENLAFDCAAWAVEAGLRVFVVASTPSLQRLAHRLPGGDDVQFIRLDRYLPPKLWPRFVERLVTQENIRLVHIHHCAPLYDSLPQLRVFAPQVQVIDSTHIVEYADGGYPRMSGVWSNFIDIHHVISTGLVDYFRDRFGILHNVRLGRMIERHDDPAALPRPNLTPGQKTLHVAFIGRLYYQKRPVVLALTLRALDRWARANGVELTASIVGEGPFAPAVARLLARFGLRERVTMLPGNADVPALLGRSDILLLPSNNEGLALVCYEAIRHGCIPVGTDVGAQSEIVPADLLVPLAPRRTVRETVRRVRRLWQDAAFLDRQHAAMRAAWSRIAADPTAREVLMPIYEQAARQARD